MGSKKRLRSRVLKSFLSAVGENRSGKCASTKAETGSYLASFLWRRGIIETRLICRMHKSSFKTEH